MERLWTKPFILMTAGMLFLFTGFYLLLPTVPMFIKELGGNEAQVGFVVGVFTLTAVLFRPIIGGLLDRYGRKVFMVWGLVLFIIAMYLYNWVGGIIALGLLRFFHGMSWAVSTTSIGTAVTDIIPASRRGEGMGWFGMSTTLAMAVGPLLGIWLLERWTFHHLFLIATALSIVTLIFVLLVNVPFTPKAETGRTVYFERSITSITVVVFFIAVSYGGIVTFLPLFADSIEVNSGLFFLVYAVTLTLTRPIAGKLSDRYGESIVIIPALAITISALIILGFSGGAAGIVMAAIVFGIGFGSAQPALQAATLAMVRPDQKGIANASFFTAFDLGIGIGSVTLGAVSQYSGYTTLYLTCAVSVLAAVILFIAAVRRKIPARSTEQMA